MIVPALDLDYMFGLPVRINIKNFSWLNFNGQVIKTKSYLIKILFWIKPVNMLFFRFGK